jgi:hypothetical protein
VTRLSCRACAIFCTSVQRHGLRYAGDGSAVPRHDSVSSVARPAYVASAMAADISTLNQNLFFMQEDRAFNVRPHPLSCHTRPSLFRQHYLGMTHGVRDCRDPSAHILPNRKQVTELQCITTAFSRLCCTVSSPTQRFSSMLNPTSRPFAGT